MRDHTVCLLKECDSGCKMALDSMAQIKGYVSDQKLKNTIDGYEKKHQAMEEEAYKQLKSLGEGGKEPEMMAAAFSRMSTGMKMLMKDDNRQAAHVTTSVKMMIKGDDHEVASIVTDGCNMGIQSICGFRNQYAGASRESMDLADRLIRTEEALRDEMKAYL